MTDLSEFQQNILKSYSLKLFFIAKGPADGAANARNRTGSKNRIAAVPHFFFQLQIVKKLYGSLARRTCNLGLSGNGNLQTTLKTSKRLQKLPQGARTLARRIADPLRCPGGFIVKISHSEDHAAADKPNPPWAALAALRDLTPAAADHS